MPSLNIGLPRGGAARPGEPSLQSGPRPLPEPRAIMMCVACCQGDAAARPRGAAGQEGTRGAAAPGLGYARVVGQVQIKRQRLEAFIGGAQ